MVDARVGLVLDNRYRITEWLAAGGTGVVYRGTRLGIDKSVAVKFLHQSGVDNKGRRKRFQREAEAMSRLTHANLATIIDFGSHDGVPYLVMEFYEGLSLRAVLDSGVLGAVRAVNIGLQVLAGLASAHERGVVHRDLKPANVFVTLSLGSDHIKILDFGVAKLLATDGATEVSVTASGPQGTPQYMSPEQARGTPISPATDLYAVGILLYEMVTGRRPFDGGAGFAVLRSQVEDTPVSPREIAPEISPELATVILKAMEKNPDDRFRSAGHMASALSAVPEVNSGRKISEPRRSWGRPALLASLLLCTLGFAGWYAAEQRWIDVPGWFPWRPTTAPAPSSPMPPRSVERQASAPALDAAFEVADAAPPPFAPVDATIATGDPIVSPVVAISLEGKIAGDAVEATFARLAVSGDEVQLSLSPSPPTEHPCDSILPSAIIASFSREDLVVDKRISDGKERRLESVDGDQRQPISARWRLELSRLDIDAGIAEATIRLRGRGTRLRGSLQATYCADLGNLAARPPVVNGIAWSPSLTLTGPAPEAAVAGVFGGREFRPRRALLRTSRKADKVELWFVENERDDSCALEADEERSVVIVFDSGALESGRNLAGPDVRAQIRDSPEHSARLASVSSLELDTVTSADVRGRIVVFTNDHRRALFAGAFLAKDCRE